MKTSKQNSKSESPWGETESPTEGGAYQAEFVGIYLPKTWAVVERLQMALSFSGPPRVRHYGRPSRPTWLPHK